jgi:hypothetical protein
MQLELLVYILCGIIIIQIAEIIFLVMLYQKKSTALDLAEKDTTKAMAKIIENANKKAEQIIQNAVNKSEDIIYDSETFSTKVNKEMDFVFRDAMEQHRKTFDEVLNKAFTDFKDNFAGTKADFTKASEKVLAEMELLAKKEFSSFQAEMKAKQPFIETYLKQKVDVEFDQAKREIASFKTQEMSKATEIIKEAIVRITKDVLHLSIPRDQQEKLIIDALEKAKKDNIFSI